MNNALEIKDLIEKYNTEISNNEITDYMKKDIIDTINDTDKYFKDSIKENIKEIYKSIINLIYNEDGIMDISYVKNILKNMILLSNNYRSNIYNLSELSNDAYNELLEDNIYGKYLHSTSIPEEFNISHILDFDYYADLFLEVSKDKVFIERFKVAREYWRILYVSR